MKVVALHRRWWLTWVNLGCLLSWWTWIFGNLWYIASFLWPHLIASTSDILLPIKTWILLVKWYRTLNTLLLIFFHLIFFNISYIISDQNLNSTLEMISHSSILFLSIFFCLIFLFLFFASSLHPSMFFLERSGADTAVYFCEPVSKLAFHSFDILLLWYRMCLGSFNIVPGCPKAFPCLFRCLDFWIALLSYSWLLPKITSIMWIFVSLFRTQALQSKFFDVIFFPFSIEFLCLVLWRRLFGQVIQIWLKGEICCVFFFFCNFFLQLG